MQEYKIVFTGNMGAGKTTAIGLLSEIGVLNTDVANTDKETNIKETTTVGIDYGRITISDNLRLAIYGTPGQERFKFMWKIAAQNALGSVILIDSTSKNALDEMNAYIDFYHKEMGHNAIVIGITHTDLPESIAIEKFEEYFSNAEDFVLPIFPVDVRKKEDVLFLTEVLIAEVESEL